MTHAIHCFVFCFCFFCFFSLLPGWAGEQVPLGNCLGGIYSVVANVGRSVVSGANQWDQRGCLAIEMGC